MDTRSKNRTQSKDSVMERKASKRLHPEDLKIGDDVAVSQTYHELATYCWCILDSFQHPPDELIRLSFMDQGDHHPQKVKSICLPYVLCQKSDGKHIVHDLRQLQLTRLDSKFALAVDTALKMDKRSLKKRKKTTRKKKKKTKGKK